MNIHAAENVPGPGVMPDHARTFVATAILPQRAQSRRANERQAGSLLTKIYKNEALQSMQRMFDERMNIQKQARGLKGLQNKIWICRKMRLPGHVSPLPSVCWLPMILVFSANARACG